MVRGELMADSDLQYGDVVVVPWGLESDVQGTVQEIYGPASRRHVVILLSPDVSGPVVDEPTTVSLPLDAVRKVSSTV
jgi:hypothetical protein